MQKTSHKPHIVVLGGGFGGLELCRRMRGQDVRITLIDRQNHHLFQPLLYQVATAGLSAPEIAQPIRSILGKQDNVHVLLDEATSIDTSAKQIDLRDTGSIAYDYLVVAVGARTNYFGNDHWAKFAPGLKSLDDATGIRKRVLLAYEQAERERDARKREALMRIVVIGGGPTGVELAGAFAELANHVLAKDFKNIEPSRAQIILLEVAPRILQPFSEKLSASGTRQLESLGVEVRTEQKIKDIREGVIELEDETIEAGSIFWGAGVRASPLCATLDTETDRAGRIQVEPDLSLAGHPEVFAVGDIVALKDVNGKVVPGVSPAAMQMGSHVAKILKAEFAGKSKRSPFAYFDKGNMATLGRSKAVAQIGKVEFSGLPAWLAWLLVHLVFLIGFRNKLAVLLQWFYSYINFRRGARIITGLDRLFRTGNPELKREDPEESVQNQPLSQR